MYVPASDSLTDATCEMCGLLLVVVNVICKIKLRHSTDPAVCWNIDFSGLLCTQESSTAEQRQDQQNKQRQTTERRGEEESHHQRVSVPVCR